MDKEQLKKKLHQYIDDLQDESALHMLHEAAVEYGKPAQKDILDELTPEQLKKLEEAMKLADEGKTIPHPEALKRIATWRTK